MGNGGVMVLIYVFAALLLAFVFAIVSFRVSLFFAKKSGKYPKRGNVQQGDIIALIAEGHTILALRAYRELHRCGLIEAKKAIDKIKMK
jgi:ribosomal protein L7/L12